MTYRGLDLDYGTLLATAKKTALQLQATEKELATARRNREIEKDAEYEVMRTSSDKMHEAERLSSHFMTELSRCAAQLAENKDTLREKDHEIDSHREINEKNKEWVAAYAATSKANDRDIAELRRGGQELIEEKDRLGAILDTTKAENVQLMGKIQIQESRHAAIVLHVQQLEAQLDQTTEDLFDAQQHEPNAPPADNTSYKLLHDNARNTIKILEGTLKKERKELDAAREQLLASNTRNDSAQKRVARAEKNAQSEAYHCAAALAAADAANATIEKMRVQQQSVADEQFKLGHLHAAEQGRDAAEKDLLVQRETNAALKEEVARLHDLVNAKPTETRPHLFPLQTTHALKQQNDMMAGLRHDIVEMQERMRAQARRHEEEVTALRDANTGSDKHTRAEVVDLRTRLLVEVQNHGEDVLRLKGEIQRLAADKTRLEGTIVDFETRLADADRSERASRHAKDKLADCEGMVLRLTELHDRGVYNDNAALVEKTSEIDALTGQLAEEREKHANANARIDLLEHESQIAMKQVAMLEVGLEDAEEKLRRLKKK